MEANKLNDTMTQLRGHILMPRRRAARQTGISGSSSFQRMDKEGDGKVMGSGWEGDENGMGRGLRGWYG